MQLQLQDMDAQLTDMQAQLTTAQARGAAGLKIFKSLGLTVRDAAGNLIAVDDPRLDPVWQRCGELGMPVLPEFAAPKRWSF